jgi:transposase
LKRRSKVIAVLDQIEAEELRQRVEQIPDHISLQELAEQVVRGKVKLAPAQQRMLIELFPFYMPKLSAVGRCWILDQ